MKWYFKNLFHVKRLLLLFLFLCLVDLHRVVKNRLDPKAVHPSNNWLYAFLVLARHEMSIEGLLHHKPKQSFP